MLIHQKFKNFTAKKNSEHWPPANVHSTGEALSPQREYQALQNNT
jgi:hypothetical protein